MLSPFLGPLGTPMPFLGLPLSGIAGEWYIKYGDPTFAAILGGTFQWVLIGLVVDLLSYKFGRKRDR